MQRERLTITLEPELINAIDQVIDKDTLRNRSQAIEHLLREGLGLHQLQQAFLFWDDSWSQGKLESTLNFLAKSEIRELFFGTPSSLLGSSDIALLIESRYPGRFKLEKVPLDFGNGGALALQKNRLKHSFLIIWPETARLPDSLLPVFLFHRQHQNLLTQVLAPGSENTYQAANLVIAEPDMLNTIPAGQTDIRITVFPELIKSGKVRAYVSQ